MFIAFHALFSVKIVLIINEVVTKHSQSVFLVSSQIVLTEQLKKVIVLKSFAWYIWLNDALSMSTTLTAFYEPS